ncbi:MAG: hypothetical protein Q9221_007567 [Calogaya cf. arnoldii]
MENIMRSGTFNSDIFKIVTRSSTKPFYVHADVLARSDPLRKLVEGPWKESVEHTIDWTEWEPATVERFIQWLYTDDYISPYPTLVHPPIKSEDSEDKPVEIAENASTHHVARIRTNDAETRASAPEGPPRKKRKLVPLFKQRTRAEVEAEVEMISKRSQAEEFDQRCENQESHENWDYSAYLGAHAELYIMACRYLLQELSALAFYRLRSALENLDEPGNRLRSGGRDLGKPLRRSPVPKNIMGLILDVCDKLGNPIGNEEPVKDLLTDFVALNFKAFQASGIEDWATSDNGVAREFISGLMPKLMLKVKGLEDDEARRRELVEAKLQAEWGRPIVDIDSGH